jgi:two-component system chemotaxis response regulator CheY
MRVLIADDEFTSRKILHKSMETLGECDMACNGKEAWEAFQTSHREGRPYELVLLDIMMPEMDGGEVLKLIRGLEGLDKPGARKPALIAMATTATDKESVLDSFRAQCDGYITKPYTKESLLSNLRKFGILGN